MRRTVLGVALAATALVTSACGQGLLGGDSKKDKGPILLGMDIPLSGSSAEIGPYMKNGGQLAVDEINAKGGVLGRKLGLRAEDEACDPKSSVAAANKLVAAHITVSVGGYCSGATLPTLPVFDRAKIPMIIPAANSTDLVAQHLKHVFMINGTGDQQAAAAVTWLTKSNAKRVALADDNTSYSKDITVRAAAGLTKSGGPQVVDKESVNPGESDYSANVANILKNKPDFVYWTGYYQEGGLLVRQLRQAGYKGKFMVADGSVDAKLVKIAGSSAAEGSYATMTQTPDTLQGAQGWIAQYKQKFGTDPGPYSPQAYDAVRVAAEAIKNADSTDGDKIATALTKINGFPIFSGPLKFTPQHTLTSGGFVILVVKDGKFVLQDALK
jgi:branched-chain amino acid transport system substrate-binding protein